MFAHIAHLQVQESAKTLQHWLVAVQPRQIGRYKPLNGSYQSISPLKQFYVLENCFYKYSLPSADTLRQVLIQDSGRAWTNCSSERFDFNQAP